MVQYFQSSSYTPWPTLFSEVFVNNNLVYSHRLTATKTITVTANTVVYPQGTVLGKDTTTHKYVPAVSGTTYSAYAILADTLPISVSDWTTAASYIKGEFNFLAVIYDQSWAGLTTGTLIWGGEGAMHPTGFMTGINALRDVLEAAGLILKDAASAAPVTAGGSI